VRAVLGLSLAGAVPAAIGGAIFCTVHGGTTVTRSIAYGFWIAAALMLLLMFVAGSKRVWRRTTLPVFEGWVFVSAAVVLTAAGAAIDAAGT
jgi:hypothetical protein